MPITGSLHPFDSGGLQRAPEVPGVFGLYEGRELIYYGNALISLRDRLRLHLNGNACTQRAVLFNFEACDNPRQREMELVREHQSLHGKLPRCNAILA
jgi:hypothetical protein